MAVLINDRLLETLSIFWGSARAGQFPGSFCKGFFFKTALILPLFTIRLPTLLMLPACPFPDQPSGNLCTGSGPMSGCEQPCLIHQLFHFRVPTPIPLESCYVLPVSPGTDVSPRLIWNLSGDWHESWWLPDCQKEYRCSCMYSHFYILHYTSLNGIFSLEYHGVEPETEAVPHSSAPSIDPSIRAFIGLGPICVLG